MSLVTKIYSSNNFNKNRYRYLVNYLVFSVPAILLFDWLFNLQVIDIQVGLILKALSIILFGNLLIFKKRKISGFIFKNLLLYFIFLNFIYALLSAHVLNNIYHSIRILYWVLGSLSFYYLYSNEYLKFSSLRKMLVYTVIIGSLFTIALMMDSKEHQNASAYLLLWCLPILLAFKQTLLLRITIFLAIVSIILTVKRGAILALVVSLIFYLIGVLKISKSSISAKFKIISFGSILIGFTSVVLFFIWDKLSSRLEDTGGSGRDIMYQALVDKYFGSDLQELIFGYGINSVQEFTRLLFRSSQDNVGVGAHSDWLQYMFDFGIFGIIFMILLHYHFVKLLRFNSKNKTNIYPAILMSYCIFLLTTIYSFILNTPDAIFFGIIISVISTETSRLQFLKKYG